MAVVKRWEQEVRRVFNRLPPKRRGAVREAAERWCAPFAEFLRACAEGREYGNNRFTKEAGTRLLRVFEDRVPPLAIVTRLSALYLMREAEARQFRDERAFRFQLVRSFRKLTSVADGAYWTSSRNRVQQVTDEIPARVREIMAEWLVDFATPIVEHVNACAVLTEKIERTRTQLASELFLPLRARLAAEHSRLERKLHTARCLLEERAKAQG